MHTLISIQHLLCTQHLTLISNLEHVTEHCKGCHNETDCHGEIWLELKTLFFLPNWHNGSAGAFELAIKNQTSNQIKKVIVIHELVTSYVRECQLGSICSEPQSHGLC